MAGTYTIPRKCVRSDSCIGGSAGISPRAVVTGAAGFIGSHLCDALLSRGYSVVAFDNLITGSLANIAHLSKATAFAFTRADVTLGIPLDGQVDAVFHLASLAAPAAYLAHPIETLRAGSIGTLEALALARRSGARFLLTSTSEIYGDPLVHPQSESYWGNVNPVGPRSCYDESKRFAEAAVIAFREEFALDTRILRIFNTYGPRMRPDDSRAVPRFIRQALAGEPLTVHGSGRQTRSLCFVDDLIAGLLLVFDRGDRDPYNIGTTDEISIQQLAVEVIRLTGSSSQLRYGPRPADDPERRRPVVDRVTSLGWSPAKTIETGLLRTIEYFRELRARSR